MYSIYAQDLKNGAYCVQGNLAFALTQVFTDYRVGGHNLTTNNTPICTSKTVEEAHSHGICTLHELQISTELYGLKLSTHIFPSGVTLEKVAHLFLLQ